MDFYQTLLAHGLRVKDPPEPDNRMRRCATDAKPKHKNGWYKLAYDGKIGWFGDFTTSMSETWYAGKEQQECVIPHAQVKEIERKRLEERRVVTQAIASAQKAWDTLVPMSQLHPYLEMKNLSVQGCSVLRIDRGGRAFKKWYEFKGKQLRLKGDLLVMPMYDKNGILISLQAIDAEGTKLFWKDAPTKGLFLKLARPGSTVTIITEGFATGLALFQTIPTSSVIIGFNADNMVTVAQELKISGMAVVAADNDHETAKKNLARTGVETNPGIEKGRKAAEVIGCLFVYPEGIQGSDWLDALNEWNSPSRVRMAVLRAVRRAGSIKPA